jgi:hypothetical protein
MCAQSWSPVTMQSASARLALDAQGVQPVRSQVGANALRLPAELVGQHPHNLFLNLVAHAELILGDGSDDRFERRAAELHRGNQIPLSKTTITVFCDALA